MGAVPLALSAYADVTVSLEDFSIVMAGVGNGVGTLTVVRCLVTLVWADGMGAVPYTVLTDTGIAFLLCCLPMEEDEVLANSAVVIRTWCQTSWVMCFSADPAVGAVTSASLAV